MMMLSGYTLGFFFPRQVKSLAAAPARMPPDDKIVAEPRDLNRTRPDAESESREVPAGYYFFRYF